MMKLMDFWTRVESKLGYQLNDRTTQKAKII